MSLMRDITITCPKCGKKLDVTVYDSVTETAEIKEELLSGKFGEVNCDGCGTRSCIDSPFLYHSPKNRYMISVRTDFSNALNEQGMPEGYRFRQVRDLTHLAEKIRIFDADLDDATIEGVKQFVSGKIGKKDLCFVEKEKDTLTFCSLRDSSKGMVVSTQAYDIFYPSINSCMVPADTFAIVDENFATDVLQKFQKQ